MAVSNEQKLILYCSQARTNQADLDKIKALSTLPMDWRYVSDTALSNGIAPLLYYNLKKILMHHDIPSITLEQLKEVYLANTAKNTYFGNELCRILGAFARKFIDVMVLKGAALANLVYPDVGLRMYGDIDILVKKEDLAAVEKLLPELGYVSTRDSIGQEYYKEKHHHLAPYIHLEKNIILEIHWNITNRFPINVDNWWERSRIEKIMGCSVRVLSPNDLFLHLCIHTSQHDFKNFGLRALCDISETIKCYGDKIDWTLFQNVIDSYPINSVVYSILYYAKKMFYINVDRLNWLTYQKADLKLISFLEELIFRNGRDKACMGIIYSIFIETGFKRRFMVIMNYFFPNRKYMSNLYSLPLFSKKIFFYYLIHPFMLIIGYRKYIGQFFNSLRRFS